MVARATGFFIDPMAFAMGSAQEVACATTAGVEGRESDLISPSLRREPQVSHPNQPGAVRESDRFVIDPMAFAMLQPSRLLDSHPVNFTRAELL